MQVSIEAVVVREKRLEDYDRLLTLLTRDKGIITAYAKGAAKLRGSMVSSTELLCYSRFQIFQKGDKYFVDKAESNTVFFGIRQDFDKLSLATYFCQLLCELVPPLDCEDGYLRLMLNALHYLEKDKMSPTLLKPLFELRLLSMAGYMPDLIACCGCGELPDGKLFFSPSDGVVYCEECRPPVRSDIFEISAGNFSAMRHIIYSDFNKLYSFRLSDTGAWELNRTCRTYLLAQVERMLPALSYYETLVCPFGGKPIDIEGENNDQ